MSKYTSFIKAILLIVITASTATAGEESRYFTFGSITIQMADSSDAAAFITQPDHFTKLFSSFDIHGRFRDTKPHTEEDYLKLAGQQVRTWTKLQQQRIINAFEAIETYNKEHNITLTLPDTVILIKSTCKEEFGAGGYTRKNAIILNMTEQISTGLIAHELFHVYSRYNEAARNDIYSVIGFKKCNVIDVRDAMNNLNITNPDCPVISHYVTVGDEDLVLVLFSKKPYEGGNVFEDYVDIGLIPVEGDDAHKKPVTKNGKAIIYTFEQKAAIFGIVGTNTPYLLHPEEICAENFSALVTGTKVNQPEILQGIKEQLR